MQCPNFEITVLLKGKVKIKVVFLHQCASFMANNTYCNETKRFQFPVIV